MQYPGIPNQYPGVPSRPMLQQPTMAPQRMMTSQPTQWQAAPGASPAYVAVGVPPKQPAYVKARGVAEEVVPAPKKIYMPSPEELGVRTKLAVQKPQVQPALADWNALHARMEKLGVLRYQKERSPTGGVRVTLLLPTADPTRGQPVEAVAETEAAAALAALARSEAWMQQR